MSPTTTMNALGDDTDTKKSKMVAPPYDAVGEWAPIPEEIQAQWKDFVSTPASAGTVTPAALPQSPVQLAPTKPAAVEAPSKPAEAAVPSKLAECAAPPKPAEPAALSSFQSLLDASRARQNQAANSIFSAQQNNQSQAPAAGGLFGAAPAQNTNTTTTSLFGNTTNNNPQQSQPAAGTSLFGNTNTNTNTNPTNTFGTTNNSSSLFGNSNTTPNTNSLFARPATGQAAPAGGSLFGAQQSTTNNNNNSMFGNTARPNQQQAPSLLGATQAASLNQSTPFGRLGMGQSTTAATGQAASQVTIDNLKGTTRFEDCADSVRQELEALDKMIQQQETFAREIEAFLPKHEENVNSLGPDIEFVRDKADDVEQSLASDAQGVDAQRKNAERDLKDGRRLQRIVTNLALPQSYQYPNLTTNGLSSLYSSQQRSQQQQNSTEGDENYDTDLIGNYFLPMAAELQRTMDSYASNLTEIEQHMRVIEESTVQQAQQLAQRRSGMGGAQPSSDDTVRELAGTLRGFEESILGVAGIVGECREGVTQLALGRLGSQVGRSYR